MSVLERLINIIKEIDSIEEAKPKANATTGEKKSYARKQYRTRKNAIKSRKDQLKRGSEGKKREKLKPKLDAIGRTPTNKRQVRYK